jgi:hypothetical protein
LSIDYSLNNLSISAFVTVNPIPTQQSGEC